MSADQYRVLIQAVLKACQDGKPQHELLVPICDTPQYLIDYGFPALPIVISGKTVDKVHFDHGITKGVLERLPSLLDQPKAVFKSATQAQSAVVLTFEMKGSNNILVPIHSNKEIGRQKFFNVVASIYDKDAAMEARWRREGLLIWEPAAPAVSSPAGQALAKAQQQK